MRSLSKEAACERRVAFNAVGRRDVLLRRGNRQSPFRRFVVSGSHLGAAQVESSQGGRKRRGVGAELARGVTVKVSQFVAVAFFLNHQ